MVLGDGNLYYDKNEHKYVIRIFLHKQQIDIVERVREVIRSVLKKEPCVYMHKPNVVAVKFYSKYFTHFINRIYNILKERIHVLKQDFVLGVVEGLIDSDGCVDVITSGKCREKPTIRARVFSRDHILLESIYRYLRTRLGVSCSLVVYRTSSRGRSGVTYMTVLSITSIRGLAMLLGSVKVFKTLSRFRPDVAHRLLVKPPSIG